MESHKNRSLYARLRFAAAGIAHGLRTERSLRTQALVLILVVLALLILRPAPVWWALVILCGAVVLAAELFNTAIERLADHLHPQLHPEIRLVKDCAAGGVLIAAIGASGVGVALVLSLIWDSR